MEKSKFFKMKYQKQGIQSLIDRYRTAFRVRENLNYYQDEDLKFAEKKFIKFALRECRLDFLQ